MWQLDQEVKERGRAPLLAELTTPRQMAHWSAFSLPLCTAGFSEVRLFLGKSRVVSGCSVNTRSEIA
jgi:hypothetical protein